MLKDILAAGGNRHAREELFNYRLLYDLKLAAFVAGYHLQTYYSDVDHDGFDVIFDDREVLRKIQLKSVDADATTQSWDIHRHVLRPCAPHMNEFGFRSDGPEGVEGGVILMEYKVADEGQDIGLTYWYTELTVIAGIALGLLERPGTTKAAAERLRLALAEKDTGDTPGKIGVVKGMFVRAASPQHLLCLLGLRSVVKRNWQRRLTAIDQERWGQKSVTSSDKLREYQDELPAVLREVCGHDSP